MGIHLNKNYFYSMLDKLLFKNQDRLQLIIAVVGSFLGVTFLVTSIHYLIKVQEFGEGEDIMGPNTIIVQKKHFLKHYIFKKNNIFFKKWSGTSRNRSGRVP